MMMMMMTTMMMMMMTTTTTTTMMMMIIMIMIMMMRRTTTRTRTRTTTTTTTTMMMTIMTIFFTCTTSTSTPVESSIQFDQLIRSGAPDDGRVPPKCLGIGSRRRPNDTQTLHGWNICIYTNYIPIPSYRSSLTCFCRINSAMS